MSALAFLGALAAAQATAAPAVPELSFKEAGKLMVASERKQAATRSRIRAWPNAQLVSELNKAVSGKTKLIYQLGHGVYVEYTGPDGQLRMWYPDNVNVVKGGWAVREVRGKMRICFKYAEAVNPVTQVYEPTECVPPEQTLSEADVIRSWDGDVFQLMDDKIPYSKGAMDMPSPERGS